MSTNILILVIHEKFINRIFLKMDGGIILGFKVIDEN